MELGWYVRVIEVADKALELDPNYTEAYGTHVVIDSLKILFKLCISSVAWSDFLRNQRCGIEWNWTV